MVTVQPFRALRPPRELVDRVAAPPYDVVDTAEARALADGNPDSYLRISRPEVGLPVGAEDDAERVHARGRAALADFVARGVLVADAAPGLLVYRQEWRGTVQTGVVGTAAVADYRSGRIAVHEHTRRDKEDDRTRHIEVLGAHDEPVFLMYRPDAPGAAAVAALVAEVTAGEPTYDLTRDDVHHTLWTVPPDRVAALADAFDAMPRLYVSDGHHRSAAAARLAAVDDAPGAQEFLAVVFPSDELTVLPYHRVVRDLAGRTPDELRAALAGDFLVSAADSVPTPARHEAAMYLDGAWWLVAARPGVVDETDPIAALDVSLLQDRVLAPLLGIGDPRTDARISFVGGIRGTDELVRLVDSGRFAVAFALHPTATADVMDVADAGRVMPPKSTWFEPKLLSGLFVHPIA